MPCTLIEADGQRLVRQDFIVDLIRRYGRFSIQYDTGRSRDWRTPCVLLL